MVSLDFPDVIKLQNWPSSHEYRTKDLKGVEVLLSFSRGKDALAAWFALIDAGATVYPFYFYSVATREADGTYSAGMRFEQESLAYYERFFGCHIMRMVKPSFWRMQRNYVFQPPERGPVIDAAEITRITYEDMKQHACTYFDLPADTWVVDGVRAADSPNRRTAMVRFGPHNHVQRKYRAVYDWRKKHVMDVLAHHGCELPIDYEMWGRTFDGIDARFTGPLAERLPEDFATLRRWYPLLTADLYRQRLRALYQPPKPSRARKAKVA